jgi:hypothetical protein
MKKLYKICLGILWGLVSFFILWIFFYILSDNYSFHLSTSNIKYASAQMAIQMFKISILVSFLLSIMITAIFLLAYFRVKRRLTSLALQSTYFIFITILLMFILNSKNYIPLIRN